MSTWVSQARILSTEVITAIIHRLDLPFLHFRKEPSERVVRIEIALGSDLGIAGHLCRICLRLLLLVCELLEDEHLALLIQGELFMLFTVESGKGRGGGRA